MGRYDLPLPKCRHKRKGRVEAGSLDPKHAHAAASVCDRPACIEDAMAWAYASTHLQPVHIPDAVPDPVPESIPEPTPAPIPSTPSEDYWDFLAEQWLKARHGRDWYVGNATDAEWVAAYDAVRGEE